MISKEHVLANDYNINRVTTSARRTSMEGPEPGVLRLSRQTTRGEVWKTLKQQIGENPAPARTWEDEFLAAVKEGCESRGKDPKEKKDLLSVELFVNGNKKRGAIEQCTSAGSR